MGKRKIRVGMNAPLFKIDSYNAGIIDLFQMLKEQKVVLIFSCYFGCPICQLDFLELIKIYPEIRKKGEELLYITQSGEKVAGEFIDKNEVQFSVIYSGKDGLYKGYGLGLMTMSALAKIPGKLKNAIKRGIKHGKYGGWEKQCPGQFVIDKNGVIIHAKKE